MRVVREKTREDKKENESSNSEKERAAHQFCGPGGELAFLIPPSPVNEKRNQRELHGYAEEDGFTGKRVQSVGYDDNREDGEEQEEL